MKIIACIDNNKGMMFGKRRQSMDRKVRQQILEDAIDAKLWMNTYSVGQFEEERKVMGKNICIAEDFLDKATQGDYCFVENLSLKTYEREIEEIILYHWNRKYPADFYFDLDISHWNKKDGTEFPGYSHEKITKEIYTRSADSHKHLI